MDFGHSSVTILSLHGMLRLAKCLVVGTLTMTSSHRALKAPSKSMVMESHQASKLDTSGTAKAVISCFQKLGVPFEMDQVQQIRDPEQQIEMVGVPKEYVSGHAFHLYHLNSPDQTKDRPLLSFFLLLFNGNHLLSFFDVVFYLLTSWFNIS